MNLKSFGPQLFLVKVSFLNSKLLALNIFTYIFFTNLIFGRNFFDLMLFWTKKFLGKMLLLNDKANYKLLRNPISNKIQFNITCIYTLTILARYEPLPAQIVMQDHYLSFLLNIKCLFVNQLVYTAIFNLLFFSNWIFCTCLLIYTSGLYINKRNSRVMVMHIENFTKLHYLVLLMC